MNKTKREMEIEENGFIQLMRNENADDDETGEYSDEQLVLVEYFTEGAIWADMNPSPQVEALVEALSLTNRPAFTSSHFSGAEKANAMLDQWLDELLANYRASMKLGNGSDK